MTDRLHKKVAIVTGAGSGLGAASAVRFAQEGAAVICADLDGDTAQATHEQIASLGGQSTAVQVDVTNRSSVEAMVARTIADRGTIDILFANAGISGTATAVTCDDDLWDRNIAVNLTGAWLSAQAVLPVMTAKKKGSVILQASGAALVGMRQTFPYAAAKAGVIGICRQMAADFGQDNIRINAIAPGAIHTPLLQSTYEERVRQGVIQSADAAISSMASSLYALGRLGTMAECADLAVFLGSDESTWMTGSIFNLDGGLTTTRIPSNPGPASK